MATSMSGLTPDVNEDRAAVTLYGNDTMSQLALVLDELSMNEQYNTPPQKLQRAYEACLEARVEPTARRDVFRVASAQKAEGSYETHDGVCTCTYAQTHPRERYGCHHSVAAVLYATWQQHLAPLAAPFPSQPAPVETTAMALEAPTMDEETFHTPRGLVAPAPAVSALEASCAAWAEERKVIARFIKQHLVENVDYGRIHYVKKDTCTRGQTCSIASHFTKPCLFKSGAEKFVGLLQLRVSFRKDEDTWEMLGRPTGVICLVCTLVTREGDVAGEGRGISDVKKEYGDANKAVKMAAISAQKDAILRTGCLSDVFTQDLDDHNEDAASGVAPATPETPAARPETLRRQKEQIVSLLRDLGPVPEDRDGYDHLVRTHTGLSLVEEHFAAIITKLKAIAPATAAGMRP